MRLAVLIAVILTAGGLTLAEEFDSPFVGPNGLVTTLYQPEFQAAPELLEDLGHFGIEGLDAVLIGPLVPSLVPKQPPYPSRLLLRGPAEVLAQAREVLVYLDAPKPAVAVSLLVAEVRSSRDFERGGHVFWDRTSVDGTPNTLMRGAFADYEPESYLRSSLTGYAPWQGTSVTFGNSPSDWAQNGVFELVLRMLQEERMAVFLAWPTVVCTEGEEGLIESTLFQKNEVVTRSGSYVEVRAVDLATGILLSVVPVRIARDAAVLDIVADISHPEPQSQINDSPALREAHRVKVSTRVTVRDRQALLIGGLKLKRRLGEKEGDPLLKDAPFVDLVASTDRRECIETELLILLKARVMAPGPAPSIFMPPGEARRLGSR